ncbi:hypothetical protein AB6809_33950 [Paraburkholderia sp. RCC_158]|uniref:hypothetical protein n=1 Tax=Paraburkholderia sp. RCC_158 TaxID=3239220 RepID=UPI0035254EAE
MTTLPYHLDLVFKWGMQFSKFSDGYALSAVGATKPDTATFGSISPSMWQEFYGEATKPSSKVGPAFDYLSKEYFNTDTRMPADEMLSQHPDLQANETVNSLIETNNSPHSSEQVAQEANAQSINDVRTEVAALKKAAEPAISESQPNTTPQPVTSQSKEAEEKKINKRAGELQDAIYAASAMSQLFIGDPNTKAKAQQGLQIASAGVKAWQSLSLYNAGVIGASAASAGVLGATVAVVSALQTPQTDTTNAELQALSSQLSELYAEMMTQYNVVSEKLDTIYWYSERTYRAVAELSYNMGEARRDISGMEDTLYAIQRETEEAREQIIRAQQAPNEAICFEYLNSTDSINSDRLTYCAGLLKDGAIKSVTHPVIFTDFGPAKLRDAFHDRSLPATAGSAYSFQQLSTGKASPETDFSLANFPEWAAHVDLYVRFANVYESQYVATLSGWANDVAELRRPGERLRNRLISLAGDSPANRKVFFDRLTQQYGSALASTIAEVKNKEDEYFKQAVSATEDIAPPGLSKDHPPCPASTISFGGPPLQTTGDSSATLIRDSIYDKFPAIIRNRGGKLESGNYLMGPAYLCITQARFSDPSIIGARGGSFTWKMVLMADNQQLDAWDVDFPSVTFTDERGNELTAAQQQASWDTEHEPFILKKVNSSSEKMRSAIEIKMRDHPEYRRHNLTNLVSGIQKGGDLKRAINELTVRKEVFVDFVGLSMPETAQDDKVLRMLSGSPDSSIVDLYGISRMLGCADPACDSTLPRDQPHPKAYEDALSEWPEVLMQRRFDSFKAEALPIIMQGAESNQPQRPVDAVLSRLDAFSLSQTLLRAHGASHAGKSVARHKPL